MLWDLPMNQPRNRQLHNNRRDPAAPKLAKEQMNNLLDDLEQARPPVSQDEVKRVGLPFLRQFGPYRSTTPSKK